MRNIVIFGDSSFAERLAKYILFEKKDNLLCFTQEDSFCSRTMVLGLPVVPLSKLRDIVEVNFDIIIGIGYINMNLLREKLYHFLVNNGFKVGKWISNNALVYSDKIGEGTIILPNTMIGPGCEIGKCNFFEASISLSHDNYVGDFNFFSTGVVLGGNAKIGDHCFLGLNSTIKSSVSLQDYTLLGAATNVINTTNKDGVYVGNPARKLEKKSLDTII